MMTVSLNRPVRHWRMTLAAFCLVAVAILRLTPALAVEPDEMLADPALESRARDISRELRCVVCQNESIDESNADLARDLRLLVRDRLKKGDSNKQVLDYIVARYGDYVLLKPPFKLTTYALWFGPLIFLLLALFGAWRFYRRPSRVGAAASADAGDGPVSSAVPLTAEEKKRLDHLLHAEDDRS